MRFLFLLLSALFGVCFIFFGIGFIRAIIDLNIGATIFFGVICYILSLISYKSFLKQKSYINPKDKEDTKEEITLSEKVVDKKREEKPETIEKPLNLVDLFNKILEDDVVTLEEAKELKQCIASSNINDDQIKYIELTVARALIDDHLDEREAEELRVLLGEYVDSKLVEEQQKPLKPKKVKPKEEISNIENIEGSFVSGKEYYIQYKDTKGNMSEREIIFLSYTENKAGNTIARSKCKKANAIRSFRADRIIEAIDVETGEIVIGSM